MNKSNNKGTLRALTAQVLYAVLEQGQSLRDCLPKFQDQVEEKDRAWMQEMVFGVLRNVPLLQYWLRQLLNKPLKGRQKIVEHLLMLGFYQIAYSRVPAHAAVSESVDATQALGSHALKGLVNGVLRNFIRENEQDDVPEQPHIKVGLPKWLYKKLSGYYSDSFDSLLEGMKTRPPLWLRVNRQQTSRDEYLDTLKTQGFLDAISVSTLPTHPDAIILERSTNIRSLPGYDQGWFSVQDGAAQLAAQYLQAEDGERILDACCAPGGKTSHILELSPNIQSCLALDNDQYRLQRVDENLKRLKLKASVKCADVSTPESWWDGTPFDRILLDAPCSATGVIRRHPDILWLRKGSDIEALVTLQKQILEGLWTTLKSGGTLLYATCSVLPDENDDQIRAFLATHADASIVPLEPDRPENTYGRQILPNESGMDGFYYAKLLKS
ncbi:16S rRNA (cytosine(967)-C(5))-methyltransferase RsmB [Alteromonas sp. a30]|uniref:16S rRNA (cytosine(967)-C(5))-methyltransferase RsmB n=1 Tax=Alteromonas sp. a30 TaxID=2730917 RepID=UPI00227E2C87|nr:16S rRNA (cytosine(967)-C(5))-methyltransferase RsmB [Alteromonas sp. a30]